MLVVSNSKIWGDLIRNVIQQSTCKVDMEFSVSYADEIAQIEKVFLEIINADERVLQDPEPNIRLSKLGDSRVIFLVRPLV